MKELKVGYFKNFGNNEFCKAGQYLSQNNICAIKLIPLPLKDLSYALLNKEIDVAITDPRDQKFNEFKNQKITDAGLVVLLQAGNFIKGLTTIDKAQLTNIPNIIVAKSEDEKDELNYHKNLLKIGSPFIAVDNFNEAALMAQSGSGYFLMNEWTAPLIKGSDLQRLFLLDHGKQLKQTYLALYRQENPEILALVQSLKDNFN